MLSVRAIILTGDVRYYKIHNTWTHTSVRTFAPFFLSKSLNSLTVNELYACDSSVSGSISSSGCGGEMLCETISLLSSTANRHSFMIDNGDTGKKPPTSGSIQNSKNATTTASNRIMWLVHGALALVVCSLHKCCVGQSIDSSLECQIQCKDQRYGTVCYRVQYFCS